MQEFPELEKYLTAEDKFLLLKALLDWMTTQQRIEFVIENPNADGYEEGHDPYPLENDEIVAAYLGINLFDLEQEKRNILNQQLEQLRQRGRG